MTTAAMTTDTLFDVVPMVGTAPRALRRARGRATLRSVDTEQRSMARGVGGGTSARALLAAVDRPADGTEPATRARPARAAIADSATSAEAVRSATDSAAATGGASATGGTSATSSKASAGRAGNRGGTRHRSAGAIGAGAGPLPGPVPAAALALLADAGREIDRAMAATELTEQYAAAHLGALRAAAAVLATRARPSTRGRRPSAWDLLTRVAPEYADWAVFFAAGSTLRQQAQAGLGRMLTTRSVDDMVRQAAQFVDLVRSALTPADLA